MKSFRFITSWSSCRRAKLAPAGLALLLTTGIVAAKDRAAASATPTNASAAELVIPLSVFNAGPQAGRNPFFPRSVRDNKASETAPAARFPDEVKLRGISVSPSRRLAIINDVTIAAGETGEIKINGRRVTVRVIAVKENSVVITIDGITEEKFLRKAMDGVTEEISLRKEF
jgi:hypothetical protein